MTDGNPQDLERQTNVRTGGGLRVFQFSLWGLFIITTGMALILSIYFGVGRFLGMSTTEVLWYGFGQLLFDMPILLVWIIGLTVAIRRLKRSRFPAKLTIIALGGLVLTYLVRNVVHMVMMHSVISSTISHEALIWFLIINGGLYTVLNTVWWILILIAIFAHRPPAALQSERCDAANIY